MAGLGDIFAKTIGKGMTGRRSSGIGNVFSKTIGQGMQGAGDISRAMPFLAQPAIGGPGDPVMAALQSVLSSIPVAPDRGAYFAPFDQAEGRAKEALATALPVIAQAYIDLRQKINEGTTQAQAAHGASMQQRQQQAQQGQAQVQALQQQSLQDLQTQGGGQPALGSLTAAAQAQAQQNLAGLQMAANSAQQRAGEMGAGIQAQGADRVSSANSAETAAKLLAQRNLDQILNQIGVQRTNAEGRYADLQSQLAQQRAGTELKIAEYLAASQPDANDRLTIANKQADLDKKLRDLNSAGGPASGIAYLQSKAKEFPTATQWLMESFTKAEGNTGAVLAAIDAAADDDGFIRYKGKGDKGKKRLSAAVLKQWAIEADAIDNQK